MIKVLRISSISIVVLAAMLWSSPAGAQQCAGLSQPFGNLLDTWITGLDDSRPVSAIASAKNAAGTIVTNFNPATSSFSDIVCESSTETGVQGSPDLCNSVAGTVGDGNVAINGNWGNPGVSGCPNQQSTLGAARNTFVVRDWRGKGIIYSVGFDQGSGSYFADYAHPDTFAPLVAGDLDGKPRFKGMSTTGTQVTLDVFADGPKVYNDCDPGTAGQLFGGVTCTEGVGSIVGAPGNFYRRDGDCGGGQQLDLRKASWGTALPFTTNPDGSKRLVLTKPTGANICAFIGSSFTILGVESDVIGGAITVAGDTVAGPRAENVQVKRSGATVTVSWVSRTELELVGFKIVTDSKPTGTSEVSGMIAAKGNGGGASYTESVRVGAFKGSKKVIVRSFLSNGTTLDSVPVNF